MPENQETKRVPCQCGGKGLLQLNRGAKWFVVCDKCGTKTTTFDTMEEACAAWNERMDGKEPGVIQKCGTCWYFESGEEGLCRKHNVIISREAVCDDWCENDPDEEGDIPDEGTEEAE